MTSPSCPFCWPWIWHHPSCCQLNPKRKPILAYVTRTHALILTNMGVFSLRTKAATIGWGHLNGQENGQRSPLRWFTISKPYHTIDMICFTYSITDAMMYSRGQRTDRYLDCYHSLPYYFVCWPLCTYTKEVIIMKNMFTTLGALAVMISFICIAG
jgi:hypothetical protein